MTTTSTYQRHADMLTGRPSQPLQTHWMGQLKTAPWPRRFVYMDTESQPADDDSCAEVFRLASACCETYDDVTGWTLGPMQHFTDTLSLWQWVGSCVSPRKKYGKRNDKTILSCHNLSFDVRVSRALLELPQLGWTFSFLRMDGDLGWARLRRDSDGAELTLCDTWLPASLESIGVALGIRKPRLPRDDASEAAWFRRCDADVGILAAMWAHIRGWMQAEDIGPFRPTAAGAGFAAYQYRYLPPQSVLVHDDMRVRALERTAAYAGRAEAFRLGKYSDITEYDFRHAYAAVCRDTAVPHKWLQHAYESVVPTFSEVLERCKGGNGNRPRDYWYKSYTALVTARVRVPADTDLPVLPIRQPEHGDRVIWPVGDFVGTWWMPELEAALRRGDTELCEMQNVLLYSTAPILSHWADWVISLIDGEDTLLAQLAKSWSRTLAGRFGMRYPRYVATHTVPDSAYEVYGGWWFDSTDRLAPRRNMKIGRQMYVEDSTEDGRETAPAIMSYIMTETRLRLLRAIDTAGLENVIYCDTDGLLVTAAGADNLERAIANNKATVNGLRAKGHYNSVQVLGPKQLILQTSPGASRQPRVAGLPARRTTGRNRDGSWNVELWERFGAALESGHADRVLVRHASMHVSGSDGRREIDLADTTGKTRPLSVYQTEKEEVAV